MPQAGAHSSSCRHLVLFIMFSCSTLISTQTMPRFSWLRSRGDTWEFHLSLLLCIVYICACIYFWLISFHLWLVLVFLFSRVCYGFTPFQHRTSRHIIKFISIIFSMKIIPNFLICFCNVFSHVESCTTLTMTWPNMKKNVTSGHDHIFWKYKKYKKTMDERISSLCKGF